ncbi:glycosyltransferase family 4 protein [Cantharellus anzutake]|uniref:glycosyltransferase family 4 protein n=1 Tax=Cantharellus anzutake TaxID=1750568 RepID=UPI001907CB20|nr:glycosyltransferase family 4 protein [Cantharellus anzutake]KAF8324277.1 glycosyltransferase family 4 protein [Cantharellus anzutake]
MISDFFHPNVGGVENHIFMLGVNLTRLGHKVIVITHSHPPNRVGVRWVLPGIKVYYIPLKAIASSATLPNFFASMPYFRPILLRERIDIVHGHASLSSMAHEGMFHAHLMGMRTVFTDHSLFRLDDATGILTNKLLEAALLNVDATICVSNTGRENTVLRARLDPSTVYVIPNALVPEQFKPSTTPLPLKPLNIIVVSRLAYRKGVDLLIAVAPKICEKHQHVNFIIGGDGPKLTALLQMREKHRLQDRIAMLGSVPHQHVRNILIRGSIFLNTSLTESFGVAILEAACAGLYVVCTKVGGVPEVLPEDMITFAKPEEDDVVRALSEAIEYVGQGKHDPHMAHARIKGMYDWGDVATRTEIVYRTVAESQTLSLWDRIVRTMTLGRFAGPIFTIILVMQCLFFATLQWIVPQSEIDMVDDEWDEALFLKHCDLRSN